MCADTYGYAGRILKVDLGSQVVVIEKLDRDLRDRFLGGRGFGAKILYDMVSPGTPPLSAENILVLATGPLTGTSAPGSKLGVVSKSPLTRGYGDSVVGGHIGPEIKYAGYDVVVIEGRADKPVYLWIDDDHVEFRDASHLWGEGCFAAERRLKLELGERVQVLCIGPAGEKQVKIACIGHAFGRQAGRCGLGAVMGAKKLKAIVVRGSRGIRLAKPKAFQEKVLELRRQIVESPLAAPMHDFGTGGSTLEHNAAGCLPTRNFQSGFFDQAGAIGGEAMQSTTVVRHGACFGCTLACSKWSQVDNICIDGPEYETIGMLGSNCGIADLETIIRANYLCDDLGLDTISTGNIVAFATECYERGIISDRDTQGLVLSFGAEDSLLKLITMIGQREGVGDTLAEGVREASRQFGKGSDKFALHSKGLEQSAYETRAAVGQVLGYAVNDRGADHNRIWSWEFFVGNERYTTEAKAERVKQLQCSRSAPDIMGMCRFVSYYIDFAAYGELITAATGVEISSADVLHIAERVFNLTRVFNLREGFSREDDRPPARVFDEPVPDGPTKGARVERADYEKLLDQFYELSGWTKTGVPTLERLKELGLADIADDISRLRDDVARGS